MRQVKFVLRQIHCGAVAEVKGVFLEPLQRENIRLAATVMIVRDKPASSGFGIEVFMMKRPGKGDFPDLHVFPGGKVEASDWQPELCPDMTDTEASERLGIEDGGLRYWMAVARECFEECGVLLARDRLGAMGFDETQRASLQLARQQLLKDEMSWHGLLRENTLTVAVDRLVYFSHWITPPSVPRRFDTRFFLAALPVGEVAIADTEETIAGEWVDPREAMAKQVAGEWLMIEPTLRSLETLAAYKSVDEALTEVGAERHVLAWKPELGKQGMQPFRPGFQIDEATGT